MFKEFAVDPTVMADAVSCAYVLDQMGFVHARMISGFPKWKVWKDLVKKACGDADVPDVQKKAILLRVEASKEKFVATDRLYRKQLDWIKNVRTQYPERPFDAVVSVATEDGISPCLVVGEFLPDDEAWVVSRGSVIERTAAAMAAVAKPLVMNSRELVFVDPYFDPLSAQWRNPLCAILAAATLNGRAIRRCEFHLKVQRDREGLVYNNKQFETICQQYLPATLPSGVQLTLVRWDELTDGERPHPRYVLTELGGIRFDVGLDEGQAGQSTDAEIVAPEIFSHRRAQYAVDSNAFRLVQKVHVRSSNS